LDTWKKNHGSLTVEAAIVIVLFIFGYLSIISITSLIRAQMIIQYSLTQTAKEISAYCYIVSKTGLMEDSARLGEEADAAKADADQVIDTVVKLYDAVDNGTKHITQAVEEIPINEDWLHQLDAIKTAGDVTQEEFNQMTSAAESMMEEAENYFSQPDAILKGLVSIVKDEGFSQIKSYVFAAPISKALVKNQLAAYGTSVGGEDVLEHLGVVNGIDGLNFTGSTLFNDGKTIEVKAAYTMKIELPFFEKREFHFIQTASTEAWGSKHGSRPWRK